MKVMVGDRVRFKFEVEVKIQFGVEGRVVFEV